MQETRKQTLAVPIYCLGQSQDKIFVARLTKKSSDRLLRRRLSWKTVV